METKSWRVFFMVYANKKSDETIGEKLDELKQQLLLANLSPSVHHILLINEVDETRPENPDCSTFFELKFIDGENKLVEIVSYSTPKLFFKNEELAFAIKNVMSQYPAGKTMVCTWDHGAFFGIFREDFPTVTFDMLLLKYTRYAWARKDDRYLKSRLFQSFDRSWDDPVLMSMYLEKLGLESASADDDEPCSLLSFTPSDRFINFDILTSEELNGILKEAFSTVDILLMMNCYMQNLHTAFALRETVSVLIAAQGDMECYGYDFKRIMSSFGTTASVTGEALTYTIMDTTKAFSKLQNSPTINDPSLTLDQLLCLFATRPPLTLKVIEMIDETANYLLGKLHSDEKEKWRSVLQKARKNSMEFDGGLNYDSVDIICWLHEILKISEPVVDKAQINSFIISFTAWSQAYTLYALKGIHYTRYIEKPKYDNVLPFGCSIYFPTSDTICGSLGIYTTATKTDLLMHKTWLKFIYQLYDVRTNSPTGAFYLSL